MSQTELQKERATINAQACQKAARIICRATGRPIAHYSGKSRNQELVAFRCLFVYIAVECGASFVAAGKAIGRSHATAIYNYSVYCNQSASWQPLRILRDKVQALQESQPD